jgi:glutaredoxin-related protein
MHRIRAGLKTYSNWPTYPQFYVKGELIGGLDIVKEMADNGELADVVPVEQDLNSRLSALVNSHPTMLFMKVCVGHSELTANTCAGRRPTTGPWHCELAL